MQTINVVGLMSGTSLDGVDAALLTTDGETIRARGPRLFRPYGPEEREVLRAALAEARTLGDRNARPGHLAAAEALVTAAHAAAVKALIAEGGADHVDLVGFHGQTVFHAPERHLTVQIGNGQALAEMLGCPVVFDFRAADVAAGGEGAPFVPAYHRALVAAAGLEPPVAVVNIGGVANVTRIGPDGELTACDTGPGNALLDDFVRARTEAPFDRDGLLATQGRPDAAALTKLLDNPFFARPAPKSLDRDAFSLDPVAELSTEDGAATLAVFTARTIAIGIKLLGGAERAIVCGGGAENPVLLRLLAEEVAIPVDTAAAYGWSPEFIEAEAFAYLAARSQAGLPLSYPGTTGVPQPMPGGVCATP